jgi:Phage stabilisation protein
MQIPILNGIYTDGVSDFRTSYPRNMVPVPKQQGISEGYLRPADGLVKDGDGPGSDRGGINWNGKLFRVMGSELVSIDVHGGVLDLGSVGNGGDVTFDYSFDRLAVSSAGALFYWNGFTLTRVTDTDLGYVVDFIWVDGYFMTTDGTSLIVTELNDPTKVSPLKYGSSEADPDSVKGLLKLRNEVYALNRYTIEVFQNVGGELFPFERIEGAQLMRGAIGTRTACVFMESLAFLGSGRNEAPAIWLGSNGTTGKLSTREIEQVLEGYTEVQLSAVVLETKVSNGHQLLYVHLPDQTLVYDGAASQVVNEPVWFTLTSSVVGLGQYRAKNFVWCYDQWNCGDPSSTTFGHTVHDVSSHYGTVNGWEFSTAIVYNEGRGAIFHELELVALTGRVASDVDPTIWTSYTVDGATWSQERPRSAGKQGERLKRLNWLQQGFMRNWRLQKFRGTSDAHISVARLEAKVEGMNV